MYYKSIFWKIEREKERFYFIFFTSPAYPDTGKLSVVAGSSLGNNIVEQLTDFRPVYDGSSHVCWPFCILWGSPSRRFLFLFFHSLFFLFFFPFVCVMSWCCQQLGKWFKRHHITYIRSKRRAQQCRARALQGKEHQHLSEWLTDSFDWFPFFLLLYFIGGGISDGLERKKNRCPAK